MYMLNRKHTYLAACLVLSFAGLSAGQTPDKSSDSSSPKPSESSEKFYRPGSDGVTVPSCYYMPSPPYTKEAKDANFQGTVLAEGLVTLEGKIEQIRILKSPGLGLDQSVESTLKTWKCKPAK